MSCEITRQLWQEADDKLAGSVQAREQAAADLEAATAARQATEAQLESDQVVEAEAANDLTRAQEEVKEDSELAGRAYQNHLDCLTGTDRADQLRRR